MYLIVERTASRHDPPLHNGFMAAGDWPDKKPIPQPVKGKQYSLILTLADKKAHFITEAVTRVRVLGIPTIFSTQNGDYRLDFKKLPPTEFVTDPN